MATAEQRAATAASSAAVAAKAAQSGSEDHFFSAINQHVGSALALAIDAVVRTRSTDPVGYLASWLAASCGASDIPSPRSATSADSKKLKQEIKELKQTNSPVSYTHLTLPTICSV